LKVESIREAVEEELRNPIRGIERPMFYKCKYHSVIQNPIRGIERTVIRNNNFNIILSKSI